MPKTAAKAARPTPKVKKQSFEPANLDALPAGIAGGQVLGGDIGNGLCNMFWFNPKARKVEFVRVPHGLVPVERTALAEGVSAGAVEFEWIEFPDEAGDLKRPERLGYGEDIENLTGRKADENRNSAYRYGSRHHIRETLTSMLALDVPDDKPLTLVITIPPSYILDAEAEGRNPVKETRQGFMVGYLGKRDGLWPAKGKKDKQWRNYQFANVIVTPEGLPAWVAYRYDLAGNVVPLPDPRPGFDGRDALSGVIDIVDLGMGTRNHYRINDGKIVAGDLRGATNPDGGILRRMIEPIQAEVYGLTGATPSVAQVDSWLRTWANSGWKDEGAIVEFNSHTLGMGKAFGRHCDNFAQWTADTCLNQIFTRGTNGVLVVGGGWLYTYSRIKDAYKDRLFIEPSIYDHTKHLWYGDLNGYGALIQYVVETKKQAK